jgi:hypothetical protein
MADLDKEVDVVARAICQETCAYYGEPPCFTLIDDKTGARLPWPNQFCDDPGCMALAHAAVIAGKTLAQKAKPAMQPQEGD